MNWFWILTIVGMLWWLITLQLRVRVLAEGCIELTQELIDLKQGISEYQTEVREERRERL